LTASASRTSLQVTIAVWHALFMREALARISGRRAGWLWLLLEPVVQISVLALVLSSFRGRSVDGTDFALFLAIGVLGYKFFQHAAQRSASAITANRGLLSYRQVKPVDTVVVRAMLEGVINLFVALALAFLAALLGHDVLPHDPWTVVQACCLLWLLGVGVGLVLSVGGTLVPEIEKVVGFVFLPLYFASGVMFSPAMFPPAVQAWLLYNPILHGIELARSAFFPGYHVVQGISLGYLAGCAIAFLLLGLALHRRFAAKLSTL
jgi:capsular polysaccharide transport system permease protein